MGSLNKVFLTGADGMLGSSICRELLKRNYKVKAVCLNEQNKKNLIGLDIEFCYLDILQKEDLLKQMQDCNYVIHTAAITSLWPRRNSLMRAINIRGTQNLMEVAKKLQISRMIHIGSASSFGPSTGQHFISEQDKYNGWKYRSDYLDSKFEAQKILLNAFKENSFPVVILNPTFMIGPYDSGPSSGKMIIGLLKNKIPGYSNGGKNFVCSQDVAIAAVNALTMGKLGECYIIGHENLSYKAFFEKVSKVIDKPFKLKAIPFWVILLVGFFNSIFARLLGKHSELSFSVARLSNLKQYFLIERSRKDLNITPTPIEIGIQQSLDWFKANGYLN